MLTKLPVVNAATDQTLSPRIERRRHTPLKPTLKPAFRLVNVLDVWKKEDIVSQLDIVSDDGRQQHTQ